ncbi:hypothetical protein M407DRAFT_12633 [Tulasnella calospora MUT 4182]|uniref:Uncharacterized protein n=1 Tax=Tulasnella calospora MUT 4182 TaxID=1051891 RepID=A0A0C3Q2V3_9AGAM|nr:hypothetical protein M407DRAFT_12633 [Tulasnella calospora MUT 4182]
MAQSGLRKPWWGWKSRSCAGLEGFHIPFAVKEYCQNQVGQVLKALQTLVWSEWKRRDLTRPHGAALRHSDWLPLYISEATIPQDRIRDATRDTDLTLCTVLWEHIPTGLCGLSFFNNHLDANARFSSFVIDGHTTSRFNEWAVGEKGKGFVLATQYFFEKVEQTVRRLEQSRTLKHGVSFRVGYEVGELKWKKSKHDVDQLKVINDDLTPTDLAGLMARRGRM